MQKKIRDKFQELFNTEGAVFASPGRINLIGEHTDYNGGFVFPGAPNEVTEQQLREVHIKVRQ